MRKSALFLLAATLGLLVPPQGTHAEEPLSECIAAVGTYLTRNLLPDGHGGTIHSRSLISLTNGGHAFRNDSDQDAGEDGIAFGEGRGAWRCEGRGGKLVELSATMLNFTFPAQGVRQIARMDYRGAFDTTDLVLRLSGTLTFLPLDADIGANNGAGPPASGGIPVEVVGTKIAAP